ncbi:MAG: hypothetical protein K2X87_13345 [Gemmataceae bacterium]|nr:hypothetical protein [Gemmataceae bacterium]
MEPVLMENEATWPPGGVLSVVRETGGLFPELAVLVAGVGPCVHHCLDSEATPKNLWLCEKTRYRDWDALRADDWVIDEEGGVG